MGKLIIIEGTDGSGKQTQTQKLYNRLVNNGINVKKISFPNYNSDASVLVKMYLSGKFGSKPTDVNAYTASTFYGIDRYASYKLEWEIEYLSDYVIISDRYTGSNMIHHGSKIDDEIEKEKYLNWLEDLEFNKFELPRPDLTIFLNVPIEYTFNLMKNRDNKFTGDSKKDIHERDEEYLKKSYYNALNIAREKNWKIINCVVDNNMLSIDDIHELIYDEVKELL
ncbi:dTMP kinase [Streptobacillus moniliformis]|uniref:Thymidylate kinase n=1 Tax=Streptobacillus moniliformis (strain ATCC 14647 / DSM 12112 / NCTC 10651 / 9901) TaxID=519441 RepID=D1AUX1_STRM9|nr:deoxynucleoside kinase [Streptobacillus moniliformis]ACZ01531.1 thymidylate kinase [Streptobacillus moniliformis DSM 12112]AVL43470.1 thymidylate kinase [Streptobacillus moniliformis]SQA13302.1 Thymidylate kinase [Streptobacillus moniliformis]